MAMSPKLFQEVETVTCLLSGTSHLTSRLGRVSLAVLFFTRCGFLAVGGRTVWREEEKDFVCNSSRLLCTSSCFDDFSPISPFNLFSLQLVVLLTHALSVACFRRPDSQAKAGWLQAHFRGRMAQLWLHLLCLLSRVLIEGIFVLTFYKVSGGLLRPAVTHCHSQLCEPQVTCIDLNSTTKNIFSLCLCAVSTASCMVCLGEIAAALQSMRQLRGPAQSRPPCGKQHC
ncbi:gap junction beta-1 protein-like [Ascaphus truei]|uniref:gap junction beta-1 protein-like n=1 Tax=Ascaphus truei TaxID=8439 RepID=UPI003F59CB68